MKFQAKLPQKLRFEWCRTDNLADLEKLMLKNIVNHLNLETFQPTARARAQSPEPEPVCRPVCRFFLAQILTLRAHFHQILTLLSAFEFQNLGCAQILTVFGLFGGLTRTFSRNSSKSLPYSALLDFKISVLAKHRVTSAYLGAKIGFDAEEKEPSKVW